MMQEKMLLFIPAYQCSKQIVRTIAQVSPYQQRFTEVIVFDNDSQDDTVQQAIAAGKSLTCDFTVIRNNENYNLGGSVKSAWLYALVNNFDSVVTLHGDDQANLADLMRQLDNNLQQDMDFLVGARFHPQSTLPGYSKFRIFGNKLLNYYCAFLAKRKIYDMIAGINYYKTGFLRSLFFLKFPNNLTFDPHFLLYAIYSQAKFTYFPIEWKEEDQISNAKVFKQAWIIFKLYTAYLFTNRKKLLETNKCEKPLDFVYPGTIVYTSKSTNNG